MNRRYERWAWPFLFAVLATFAIPWFLWGSDRLVLGLPLWLWWHIGWLVLAGLVFWTFTRRAWGLGVVRTESDDHVGVGNER